jgi:hypothetical protein
MEEGEMDESAKRKVDYQEKLELALKVRDQFLEKHPDLQSFQDELDRILAKTVGPENRMKTIAFLIEKKLCELNDSMADLQTSFKKHYNKIKVVNSALVLDNSQSSTGYLH